LLKAMRELADRIKAHQLRHLEQGKSQLHVGGVANRWTGGGPLAGKRVVGL
jgi:hypothetical protein